MHRSIELDFETLMITQHLTEIARKEQLPRLKPTQNNSSPSVGDVACRIMEPRFT